MTTDEDGFWARFERGEVTNQEIEKLNKAHGSPFVEYRRWCQENEAKHYLDRKDDR